MQAECFLLGAEADQTDTVRPSMADTVDNLQLVVQPQVLNLERLKALDTWLKKTNIKLIQVNGQRKYGGPPEGWDAPPPGAHCEVFISNISRDAYEDLLIPLFSVVGPLWEFRLMMNFSGQNRGFAYAKYATAELAISAICLLDGYVMEPGYRLSVRHSTEKRHLCIHNLPASFKSEDVLRVLRLIANGVEEVSLKAEDKGDAMFAIVAFSSHHAASMAKKIIVESFQKQLSLTVSTKWMSVINETQKPPCQSQTSVQKSAPPPPWTGPPPNPPLFCRAIGGPAVPGQLVSPGKAALSLPVVLVQSDQSCPPLQGQEPCVASPVVVLRRLCESTGFGEPLYEIQYSHTGRDGFLYFTYNVNIAGICGSFKGQVTILPGPPTSVVLKEAQRETAQQLLHRVQTYQLSL